MPTLVLLTNLKREQIPETFLEQATTFIGKELGKPETYVTVSVSPDQLMRAQGSEEPCAHLTLNCCGIVGPEKNKDLAPKLYNFIEQTLGIKKSRFQVFIQDFAETDVMWNGNVIA